MTWVLSNQLPNFSIISRSWRLVYPSYVDQCLNLRTSLNVGWASAATLQMAIFYLTFPQVLNIPPNRYSSLPSINSVGSSWTRFEISSWSSLVSRQGYHFGGVCPVLMLHPIIPPKHIPRRVEFLPTFFVTR
jgi:hypothetical protein